MGDLSRFKEENIAQPNSYLSREVGQQESLGPLATVSSKGISEIVRNARSSEMKPAPFSNGDAIKFSVIIGTRNEENNIAACLGSLEGCSQIFVIDSGSTDRTCEIAESMGATVVQYDYDGGWPKKRNWALRNLPFRNEWVLILDADERVGPELQEEIDRSIATADASTVGFYMRWRFVFLGRWMKHCWRHGWMLRLFRHGKVEYEDLGLRGEGGWDAEVHENLVPLEGRTQRLKNWLEHDTKEDLSFWIRKQNEFSTWNAARRRQQLAESMPALSSLFGRDLQAKRKWLKALFIRLPMRSAVVFFWLYFIKFGFLDGKEGFYFCSLRAVHEFNISAKMFESRKNRK